jgi:hypothetical protein
MSAITVGPIVCGACSRKFAWKPELSGKRVKCKCGEAISVPRSDAGGEIQTRPKPSTAALAQPKTSASKTSVTKPAAPKAATPKPPKVIERVETDSLDALLALSADAERAAAAMPVEIRDVEEPEIAPPPRKSGAKVGAVPLGYRRGPSAAERQKAASNAGKIIDPTRDLYAPIGFIVAGFILYVAYYGFRFNLGIGTLPVVGVGLLIVTAVKTALLVGAAFMLAGPLGVGFGELWTAVLKLAAIAVFTDGATIWVDGAIQHISGGAGGGGVIGYGIIGWPVGIGLYWGMMIYLFGMDPLDARFVVLCLGILSRILRVIIMLFLMQGILSWAGIDSQTAAAAGIGGAPTATGSSSSGHASALTTHVDELKEAGSLREARKFIADGHQAVASPAVEAWYAAGCPNVWYEMTRPDINGRRDAIGLIIQMPESHAKRAKVFEILTQYYKDCGIDFYPGEMKDTGEDYIQAGMK